MSFTSHLSKLTSNFHTNLDQVNALNEFFPLMYDEFEKNLKVKLSDNLELQGKDYHVLDLIGMISSKRLENMRKNIDEFSGFKDPELVKKTLPLGIYKIHLERTPQFLKEMSLVFVVNIFYSFLIDMIREYLIENHNLLKDSVNSSEEFSELELESYEFAQDFIRGGITSSCQRLREIFEIDLLSELDWIQFYEIFERRNIFVHNDGIPTEKYCKSFKVPKDKRLEVDREYLKNSINFLIVYQHKIENYFHSNFT